MESIVMGAASLISAPAPLQSLTDRLSEMILKETSLVLSADEQYKKLLRNIERIRAMVGHVEENRFIFIFSTRNSSEAWKVWLEDVENHLYTADDLFDEITLDLVKYYHEEDVSGDRSDRVRRMIISCKKMDIPHQMDEVIQAFEAIEKEMNVLLSTELTKLGLGSHDEILKGSRLPPYNNSATSSFVIDKYVVGRNSEKQEIVKWLLDDSNMDMFESNVSIKCIIGMGGIGKTTLAQVVYNDHSVLDRFDLRVWICVTTTFDLRLIISSIIESVTRNKCKLSEFDGVVSELQKLLKGKRFLLVLDDCWCEHWREWDMLFTLFEVGLKGSKIIVTTRSKIVSQIVGTVQSCDLEFLEDDDCLKIMIERSLLCRTLEDNTELTNIARSIAKKCKGLPSAAKTFGAMLLLKSDKANWKSVLESEIWDFPIDENDAMLALALSYQQLPLHLKRCFAYCALFPKGYKFGVDELVSYWIAQGLVRPVGRVRLEDVGADYFKDLLSKSFFQVSRNYIGDKQIFEMHDFMYSLAQLVSSHTCLHLKNSVWNEHGYSKFARHLSLQYDTVQPVTLEAFSWYQNLRSFLVMSEQVTSLQFSNDFFLKLTSLRVLKLIRLGIDELPATIGKLEHLRSLDLSYNPLLMLPEPITKLVGLENLVLEGCPELTTLPKAMKKLISLRHLLFEMKQLKQDMSPEFGRLIHLQTLRAFKVGSSAGCTIAELRNLILLRGSILIENLENVGNINEAKEAMLHTKSFLDKVELKWCEGVPSDIGAQVLGGLRPHENLEELIITNYSGILFPNWLFENSCKISRICLQSCAHRSILVNLGSLLYLKSLEIEGMSDCSSLPEFSGFHSLEILAIKKMPKLTDQVVFGADSFPRLHTLSIIDCPVLMNFSSLVNLKNLSSLCMARCPQVQSMPVDGIPMSLRSLVIQYCDILKDRCRANAGEDWPMISAIHKIEIE